MSTPQCRSRDHTSRLRCERNRGHDGDHRAEHAPLPIGTDTPAPITSWTNQGENA